MHPAQSYLEKIAQLRATGEAQEEMSYYSALENLLNAVGARLTPKVFCLMQPRNRGAGHPDGALFPAKQRKGLQAGGLTQGLVPERGVIEVKGFGEDILQVSREEQVSRYWNRYRLVLVTNYWSFVVIGSTGSGRPMALETFRMAEDETAFWNALERPSTLARKKGADLESFLKRVMLHKAALSDPRDVAWLLAEYAKEARRRIEENEPLAALDDLRVALQEALGIRFEVSSSGKNRHLEFFRSMLVQTLFDGLFAAWVMWNTTQDPRPFDWTRAGFTMNIPAIRMLFHQVIDPSRLQPLGIETVLDAAQQALQRVIWAEFWEKFRRGDAVEFFYEPFLASFDPKLRKELGVWFTPREIVQYMVARVDRVLRTELGLADGLANPNVYVLDPCTGTGSFLAETLRTIHATLRCNRDDDLVPDDVKQAALSRLFGFEILTAPFVIAHLQLGLLLREYGAPLSIEQNERFGVYLTNALTGWDSQSDPQARLPILRLAELQAERDESARLKREAPILVVIGNPPYNAFAGTASAEERGMIDVYKKGVRDKWKVKKYNLDELYVRFFRLAERRIAELSGKGVVCYISNYSWLDGESFVAMREHLLRSFDRFWIDNLHGDRKISERAPDGRTSETIFSNAGYSPGIKQGVAIALLVRTKDRVSAPTVLYGGNANAAKAADRRSQLLESLGRTDFDEQYQRVIPTHDNWFRLRPQNKVSSGYHMWPSLDEIASPDGRSYGLMEKRGGSLIDMDRSKLESRMRAYFDAAVSFDELRSLHPALTQERSGYDPQTTREKALRQERFSPESVQHYCLLPFDTRWCYYTGVGSLWNRPRPSLWEQNWEGNTFLVSGVKAVKGGGPCLYFTRGLFDDHLLAPDAVGFPIRVRAGQPREQQTRSTHIQLQISEAMMPRYSTVRANLSDASRRYVSHLGIGDPDERPELAELVWYSVLAVGFSSRYIMENVDALRSGLPRIPMPTSSELLRESASLGRQVADLLDMHRPALNGSATWQRGLRSVGVIKAVDGTPIDTAQGGLNITAGWGYFGKDGIVSGGLGKLVKRPYSPEELDALLSLQDSGSWRQYLGGTTYDVFLNDTVYWRNVPAKVWEFTVGGHQVLKKYLSYRDSRVLCRPLRKEEALAVSDIIRRITSLLLLGPSLDASYERLKLSAYPWYGAPIQDALDQAAVAIDEVPQKGDRDHP